MRACSPLKAKVVETTLDGKMQVKVVGGGRHWVANTHDFVLGDIVWLTFDYMHERVMCVLSDYEIYAATMDEEPLPELTLRASEEQIMRE